MAAHANLADPRGVGGATPQEKKANAVTALQSWMDQHEAARHDLMLLVGRDGDVAFATTRDGRRELSSEVLDHEQISRLIGSVRPHAPVITLWSGPRFGRGDVQLPELSQGVYLAAAGLFSFRFTGTGRDEVVGMSIIAEQFRIGQSASGGDAGTQPSGLSGVGTELVFVDGAEAVGWQVAGKNELSLRADPEALQAHAVARGAARWLEARTANEELVLAGVPYFAREYRPSELLRGDVRIVLLYPRAAEVARRRAFLVNTALRCLSVLVAAALLALLLARSVARPVNEIAEAANRVARGELEVDVKVRGEDELGQLAAQFNRMIQGLKERARAADALGRYLSPHMAEQIIAARERLAQGGERRSLSVLFSDLAGFTALSEQVEPERLVQLLNAYLDRMVRVLGSHGAYVDKFEGDAIMAFWGAPIAADEHAARACEAALDMAKTARALSAEWSVSGLPPLHVRIGINTGEAVVGNVGSAQKLNYTAIGDEVNLTSRLEGLNKVYGTQIIASEAAVLACKGAVVFRELDLVRVMGRRKAVRIYEVVARVGAVSDAQLALLEPWGVAVGEYRAGRYAEAATRFQSFAAQGDEAARVLADRCKEFILRPPAPDWDGVFEVTHK